MVDQPILNRKIEELFKKHSADGTTPKKIILGNMAREMRFAKNEIADMLDRMHLEQEMQKQKIKKVARSEYERPSQDAYLNDLKSSR